MIETTFDRDTAALIEMGAALPLMNTPVEVPSEPKSEPKEDFSWRDKQWHDGYGNLILVRDLTDEHLRNIIYYLHRETGWLQGNNRVSSSEMMVTHNVRVDRRDAFELMTKEANFRKLSW